MELKVKVFLYFLFTINFLIANGSLGQNIIITEIMYSPAPGKPEWIEIYNDDVMPINLCLWAIGDANNPNGTSITADSLLIEPGNYLIISNATAEELGVDYTVKVVTILKKFPRYNNDEDAVIIRDPLGFVVDSVYYTKKWGGDTGVSLERIRFISPSNSSDNWHSSASFEGSTPGKPNSVKAGVLVPHAVLRAEPNPFSPDGDGIDDETVISYELPFLTGRVKLEIFDIAGRKIRTLLSNDPTGSRNSVVWNGRKRNNQRVSIGIYIIYLEVIQDKDGKLVREKSTVVVAGQL